MHKTLFILITFLSIALASPAAAQLSREGNQPIDFTGDRFEVFDSEDYAVWTGDVQAVQGEAILTTPKLTIYGISDGTLNRLHATGGMRYTNGTEAISGDQAVYDAAKKTIIVTGNVVVVQGRQIMSGDELIYHTETGEIQFTADARKRVRGIFYQQEEGS